MSYHSKRHSELGFSKGQQAYYRLMVDKAWLRHCSLTHSPGTDHNSPSFRSWYEDELEAATGKRSTTECDRKRDFENAMEHFEAVACDGIYWGTRKYGADARRILYNIREVAAGEDIDEEYLRAIARRSLRLHEDDPLPDLSQLTYQHLRMIMGELKRFIRRGGRPRVPPGAMPF